MGTDRPFLTLGVLLLLAGPLAAQTSPTAPVTPDPAAASLGEEIPDPSGEGPGGAFPSSPPSDAAFTQRPGPVQGANPTPLRYFVGLGGSLEWTWGGFDGDTLRVTAQSVSILAPRLDLGGAFDLYGGLRGPVLPQPFGELWGEVRLKRSQQRWVFQDGQDASTLTSLALRGRSDFWKDGPLEAFALAGLRYSLLELKNAAEDPNYVIADASYSGLGLELGAGGAVELPFDLKARAGWVFLLGLTNGGSAFGSSLQENPWLFGGSLEIGLERNF